MSTKPYSPSPLLTAIIRKSRWSTEEATQIIAAWRASGLGITAFATLHGTNHPRLRRWAEILKPKTARIAEVVIVDEPPRSNSPLMIEIGRARVIVEHDADLEHLARVLRVVGATC